MRTPAVKSPTLLHNRFSKSFVYSEAIRSCLDTDILPSRKQYPRRFTETNMNNNRYHGSRIPLDPQLDQDDIPESQYERLIQKFFWNNIASNSTLNRNGPELYITGSVGSGKSTFVDYYLRHYCPEKGDHRAEFDKKLVVYFDARGLEHHAYANQAFFDRLLSAIDVHCREHGLAIPASRDSISRSQDAMKVLSDYCRSSPLFKYLVVVLDNLDNCTISVQRQVIQYVNDIQKYTNVVLHRVIIPLWPTTYDTFSQTTAALTTGKARIHLGAPLEPDFIQKRLYFIKSRIIEETRITIDGGDLKSSLEESTAFSEYVDYVFNCLQTEKIGSLIRNLASDDLRRELWLWEGVLRSAASESIWESQRLDTSRKYEYEWMESLIAGDLRSRTDCSGRIANLFSLHHDNSTPRDFLAGYHGCFLLKDTSHRQNWYSDMSRMGYDVSALEVLEQNFRGFNLLHPVPDNLGGFRGENFHIHLGAVDAYLSLVVHAAYIDNMAMITPVDTDTQSQIAETVGHTSRDLRSRVDSSIAFIEFVATQEREFVASIKERYSDNPREQVVELKWLDSKHIPSLAHKMSINYLNRIRAIRQLVMTGQISWWNRCEERISCILNSSRCELL